MEITFEYWNKFAEQTITIASLLGGFSIAVIASILTAENNSLVKKIMVAATLAASSFLISVFALTKLLMMTSNGYPAQVITADLMFPKNVGTISFLLGILSLMVVISLAGYSKSKKMGIFTTAIGILTTLIIIMMMS